MVYLTLQRQRFKTIQMNVDLKENAEIEIESTFSFHINYNEDNSACTAELKQMLRHKSDPEQLSILVETNGQFECEGIVSDDTKKEAHVMAYNLLFPYVQNLIARLTVDAGLPPLMIRSSKMEPKDVVLSDRG